MAQHSSASLREREPHVNQTTRTATTINALKRRAQTLLNDESIDAQSRAIIRYGLETNDPWLAELVRRVDAGESIVDQFQSLQISDPNEDAGSQHPSYADDSIQEMIDVVRHDKIEELAELICGAGEESAGALLVLMGMLENSTEPKVVVNTVKHLAFTRCGEMNLNGMVDTQIGMLETELLARSIQTKS